MVLDKINKINKVDSVYLDLFRGGAAQLVLLGHICSSQKMPKIQNFGVLIFFILSGFLITQTTLIKGKSYGYKNYIIDRFSRIYSAFLPALLFVLFVDTIMHFFNFTYKELFDFSFKTFICNILMLQAHPVFIKLGAVSFGSARPFWTVSIEWFYYVFFGLLFFMNLKSRSAIKYVIYGFLLLFSGIVVWSYMNGRGGGLTFYWFFGFLLAIIYNYSFYIKNIYLGTFIILFILFALYYRYDSMNLVGMYDKGMAFLFALLLMTLMKSRTVFNKIVELPLVIKFSSFLASFSYSLYLIHLTLVYFFYQIFKFESEIIEIAWLYIIINVLSYLFYLCFEKHHLRFRRKLKEMVT